MNRSAEDTQKRFAGALEKLVTEIRQDRSVLAAILCGSLSHDVVWEKSDIDLALVTIDDKKIETAGISLCVDDVNIHAWIMPRAEFRKTVQGSIRNSMSHSLLAKGKLLYTHDETIADLFATLEGIGERDAQMQLLVAGAWALSPIDKAHKWFLTRGDFSYAALWILYAATPLARIEVTEARQLADREVILQAMRLNPEFFGKIYFDLLNTKKTRKSVSDARDAVDSYMAKRALKIFEPVLSHLREVGEARSTSEIEAHFKRNFDVSGVGTVCEYLSDQKLLKRASLPKLLTKRSNVMVDEQAFVWTGDTSHGG